MTDLIELVGTHNKTTNTYEIHIVGIDDFNFALALHKHIAAQIDKYYERAKAN